MHEGTIYLPSYFHHILSFLHCFIGRECTGPGGGVLMLSFASGHLSVSVYLARASKHI